MMCPKRPDNREDLLLLPGMYYCIPTATTTTAATTYRNRFLSAYRTFDSLPQLFSCFRTKQEPTISFGCGCSYHPSCSLKTNPRQPLGASRKWCPKCYPRCAYLVWLAIL